MEINLVEESEEVIRKRQNEKLILYSMELHETVEFNAKYIVYYVTRVAGGWIYNHIRLDSGQMNCVFVPWSNDMQ